MIERATAWVQASYPFAVVRRFFELKLLDKSFVLAAQAFVALLPLVIVLVSAVFRSDGVILAEGISDRFGLTGAARDAVVGLFDAPSHTIAISWLAVVLSVLSAFSLGRRLAGTYASIFDVAPLARRQMWRPLVWVGIMVLLLTASSQIRDLAHSYGTAALILGIVLLFLAWFGGLYVSLKLMIPSLARGPIAATALVGVVGQLGLSIWAAIYMPRSLTSQAEQFGPIGVTFALFTFVLVAATIMLVAPLIVSVWNERAAARRAQ